MLNRYNSSFITVRIYCFLKDILYFFLSVFMRQNKRNQIEYSKILLNNGAHFGDVLLSLQLVNYIKRAHPNCEIGMIIGSWTVPMVKECTDIDDIYIVDHWKMNRSKIPILRKIARYISTRKMALTQIKSKEYTVAIDLFTRYPTTAFLFFQANIPCRVGYSSGGGGALLTHALQWKEADRHIIEYQAELLRAIHIPVEDLETSYVNFHYDKSDEEVLLNHGLKKGKYLVFHIGAGDPVKEWSKERWSNLTQKLSIDTGAIVFTGAGEREKKDIADILANSSCKNAYSLCGVLSIYELIQIIHHAHLFVGCDSFAGHIAAMCKTSQVSIMYAKTKKAQWQPYGNIYCTVICPLYTIMRHENIIQTKECDGMDVSVEQVFSACNKYLVQDTANRI